MKADLQQSMNKKEEQVQKYAIKILKLETKCKNNEMTLNQQHKTIESLKTENKILKEENEKFKDELCQKEQTKLTENENQIKDRNLKSLSRQNEELRKQITWYEKELDIMRQKLNVLSHQTQNQSSTMSKDVTDSLCESVKKKETVTKNKVSDVNGNSKSTSSILQECKDLCAGPNSRSNLQHMKNKILFAEAKRTESKPIKDSSYHDRADRVESEQNHETLNDLRRLRNGSEPYFETLAKLSANKQSPSQTSLIKQKASVQVKKPLVNKSLKKHPRWVRKPLR